MLLSGAFVESAFGRAVYATRTFFGVYRVREDDRLHYRFMFHGTTLHGMQSTLPERRHESLSYFHRTGPIGQVFAEVPGASQATEVAVVGLGVGSLASYAGPAQRWTFYEIDPAVERIARNPDYFTYLEECGDAVQRHDRRCPALAGAGAPAAVRPDHPRRVQLGCDSDPPADARGDERCTCHASPRAA